MCENRDKFIAAIERFDAANSQDPTRVLQDGKLIGAEVLYARRMTEWLKRLYPQASEPLQLAARAQHICRWKSPRSDYPMDRAGYHRWRTALYSFHAETAGNILQEVGYEPEIIARVQALLKKQRLKADPEMLALEDVICVVFLENYFAEFAAKHDEEKVIGILRRTWAKMSEVGHAAALGLPMPETAARLVKRALG